MYNIEQSQADRLRFRTRRHVPDGRSLQTQRDLLWKLRVRSARDSDGYAIHSADG